MLHIFQIHLYNCTDVDYGKTNKIPHGQFVQRIEWNEFKHHLEEKRKNLIAIVCAYKEGLSAFIIRTMLDLSFNCRLTPSGLVKINTQMHKQGTIPTKFQSDEI